jgi:mannonate dehydratase
MKGSVDDPVPRGMVWNMRYDLNAPGGYLEPVTHEQLWDRAERFLKEIIPVAEEAGVKLAAHPDDPPLEWVRGMPRLVWRPELYQKLLDLVPSPSNSLEFCLGTIAEMAHGDVYEAVERYSAQKAMGYIHFRNIRGKAPFYEEDFIDEGDVDMFRVLKILHKNGFDGVLIPDHTPLVTCDAPWHAGMAYAVGYMKAAIAAVERGL